MLFTKGGHNTDEILGMVANNLKDMKVIITENLFKLLRIRNLKRLESIVVEEISLLLYLHAFADKITLEYLSIAETDLDEEVQFKKSLLFYF